MWNKTGLFELNAVVSVAQKKSFRQAAIELGMSASAVSHAIGGLEQRLGVRLFNRTTRSVSLSDAGAQFLARMQPAMNQIRQALEEVSELQGKVTGNLRLNASEPAARFLMGSVITPFLRRYPDIKVDLVADGRLVDIVAEGFDAGVRLLDQIPADMIAVQCTPAVRFVVVGAPDYLRRHGRPQVPPDLARHVCIRARAPAGAVYAWDFEQDGKRIEVEVHGPLTLDNHHLMLDAAVAGVGLAWMNAWTAADLIAAGRLVPVLDDWAATAAPLALYYPGHRHVPPGLKALIHMIKEAGHADRHIGPA